jgi:2-dehydropantoate 2-reductase
MAPDIATGRTEIQAYNGHLIRLAGAFPCPRNRAALGLIETMVRDQLSPARVRLQSLGET